MSQHEQLGNPFCIKSEAPTNLTALAEQGFLSKSDIAKLKELESAPPNTKYEGRDTIEGVSLEEGMTPEERENKEIMETRKRIIAWAEKHDLGDEDWVDETFEFQPDGTAICPGDLNLYNFKEVDLPREIIEIRGDLFLDSLTSAEGLNLPSSISGGLYLNSLTSAEGLNLPKTVGGDLNLQSLTTAEGLQLPDAIKGSLLLNSLTSAEGLNLPKTVGGDLNLQGLTSAEGLQLPDAIGRDLFLTRLTSARGLQLPEIIGRDLNLNYLRSAEDLVLTDIKGSIFLRMVPEYETQQLREKYPNLNFI